MSYNFTKKVQTKDFEVQIDVDERYGYFEHNDLGDECAGGLWFDDEKVLVDYDGVSVLPAQVRKAIQDLGYVVE